MILFYKNAVNVFTDCSAKYGSYVKADKQVVTSGFITTINGGVINSGCFTMKASSMYGELYAIKMGIMELLRFKETDMFLNIFSDSKINIYALREWLPMWLSNQKNYTLRTKDKKPVSNQELMLDIMKLILEGNVHISLFHIAGHKKSSNVKDMMKFVNTFNESNSLRLVNNNSIPMDIFMDMANWNDSIDKYTRKVLHKELLNENSIFDTSKMNFPVIWFPRDEDIKRYKQLLT